MPSTKNINQVSQLQEKLTRSKAVVLADYRGLSVKAMNDLRQQVAVLKGELKVTKNRLLKIAFRKEKYPISDEISASLTGPSAVLFCYEDEIGPIKALYDYARKNASPKGDLLPELKAAFLDRDLIVKDRLITLAQLPGKNQLQAKLVGTLNAPIYGLVNVLSGNLRQLVYVLGAIRDKKNKLITKFD